MEKNNMVGGGGIGETVEGVQFSNRAVRRGELEDHICLICQNHKVLSGNTICISFSTLHPHFPISAT